MTFMRRCHCGLTVFEVVKVFNNVDRLVISITVVHGGCIHAIIGID